MIVSIEVPVIRGGWLMQCIDSVLQQTSSNWRLTLYWDQGDALSENILRQLSKAGSPQIQVIFGKERLGIARARQLLTQRSYGELVLPLDDDDILMPEAVEQFLLTAAERPWAGIIRARRGFIDDEGGVVEMNDWFAFEQRNYFKGATCDITNHSQPYAIRRKELLDAGGWSGFTDYEFLGEDCSCFTKIEERAEVELLDAVLYQYRIHQQRTSLRFGEVDANEMWRRIADDTILRRRAPVKRANEKPPFKYIAAKATHVNTSEIDVVIPFWETNERELDYDCSRPVGISSMIPLRVNTNFSQDFTSPIGGFSRMEVAVCTTGIVEGYLCVALFRGSPFSPAVVIKSKIKSFDPVEFEFIRFRDAGGMCEEGGFTRIEITFEHLLNSGAGHVNLHIVKSNGVAQTLIRFFRDAPGHCRKRLDGCIASLHAAGINDNAIHVMEKQQSSSANRNEASRNCTRPWICYMDDDAQLGSTDTLQVMMDTMLKFDASLCGPKLLTAGGNIYSGVPYTDPLTMTAMVGGMGEKDNGQYNINAIVPWLPSTVLITHVSVWLSTGGFDEGFQGSQHEDVDFSLRARARGFKCCYAGKAMAIHYNMLRNGHFTRNMQYLKRRWQNRKDLFV